MVDALIEGTWGAVYNISPFLCQRTGLLDIHADLLEKDRANSERIARGLMSNKSVLYSVIGLIF